MTQQLIAKIKTQFSIDIKALIKEDISKGKSVMNKGRKPSTTASRRENNIASDVLIEPN